MGARCPKELDDGLDGHAGYGGRERWRGAGRARQRDGENCVLPTPELGGMLPAGGAVERRDHAEAGDGAFRAPRPCAPDNSNTNDDLHSRPISPKTGTPRPGRLGRGRGRPGPLPVQAHRL